MAEKKNWILAKNNIQYNVRDFESIEIRPKSVLENGQIWQKPAVIGILRKGQREIVIREFETEKEAEHFRTITFPRR